MHKVLVIDDDEVLLRMVSITLTEGVRRPYDSRWSTRHHHLPTTSIGLLSSCST